MARDQFWFVDACRSQVDPALSKGAIAPQRLLATWEEDGMEMRQCVLHASASGAPALALPGGVGTAFGAALLAGLAGAVAPPMRWPATAPAPNVWPVNAPALLEAITLQLAGNPATAGLHPSALSVLTERPLVLFDKPPPVPVRFVVVSPRLPASVANLTLQRIAPPPPHSVSLAALAPCPYAAMLPAGHYSVQWNSAGAPQVQVWFASLATPELTL